MSHARKASGSLNEPPPNPLLLSHTLRKHVLGAVEMAPPGKVLVE